MPSTRKRARCLSPSPAATSSTNAAAARGLYEEVLKNDGSYDRAATKERVAEVALGVAQKIGLGVITVPPPEPEMPAVESTAE